MRYYLAHPYGGNEENRAKAANLKDRITAILAFVGQEVEIINPLEKLKDCVGMPEHEILKLCIGLMRDCDGVVFAPGWRRSHGCRYEHFVAHAHGIPRILLDDEDVEAIA